MKDIHAEVASKIFDVPVEEVTKEQRKAAKVINFAMLYLKRDNSGNKQK